MDIRRVKVVVADDDDAFRAALVDTLAVDHGIHVVEQGTDASAAAAMCAAHQPDVALVDLRMPGGGGERAAEEIGRVSPGTHVVALSAFDSPAIRRRMRARGVAAYLVKGAVTGPELRATVLALATGRPVDVDGIVLPRDASRSGAHGQAEADGRTP